jgi:hypothetical protein
VTASDDRDAATGSVGRSLADQALDILVFAPAGALITAVEDLPEMAAKGRARLDQQLRNARLVGRFAFDMGRRQLGRQVEQLTANRTSVHDESRTAAGTGTVSGAKPAGMPKVPAPSPARGTRAPGAPAAAQSAPPSQPRDPAVDNAIPDYDALSASQVVRRLDALAPDDLRAIERHELANRGRRTILNRAKQLLDAAERPGTAAP